MRASPSIRLAAVVAALLAAETTALTPRQVDDRDGDGRLTGRDINLALQACGASGCGLQLLPATYEDVAIVLDDRFEGPVTIRGAGMGRTVLRAPVPADAPVIAVDGAPGGVRIEELTLDGRKQEQPDGVHPSESVGIRVTSPARRTSPDGTASKVEAVNFLSAGVRIRDGRNWTVEDARIRHVGCHLRAEPCPAMVRAGMDPNMGGRRVVGFGIQVIGREASGARVLRSRVEGVTKIGIEIYTPTGSTRSSQDWVSGAFVEGNSVRDALGAGITVNGGRDVRIEGNDVVSSGGPGVRGNSGAGITASDASAHLTVVGNTVRDIEGPGLRIGSRAGPLEIASNRVERVCTARRGSFGAIQVAAPRQRARQLRILQNVVDAPDCAFALQVSRWDDVEVSGGRYAGGSDAGLLLHGVRHGRVAALEIAARGPTAVWMRAGTEGVRVGGDVVRNAPVVGN